MGSIRSSQTTTALPLNTLKSNQHDNTVNVSTPVKAADAVKDLEGAIATGGDKDSVRLATGVEGDQVTYTEISKDEARQLLGQLKEKLAHGENINLSRVQIPANTSEQIQLSYEPQHGESVANQEHHDTPAANQEHPAVDAGHGADPSHATGGKGDHGGHHYSPEYLAIMNDLGLIGKQDPNGNLQNVGKYLEKAFQHGAPTGDKIKYMAMAVARFQAFMTEQNIGKDSHGHGGKGLLELLEKNPKFKGAMDALREGVNKMPGGALKSAFSKLVLNGQKSEILLGHMGKLMDDKLDMKDARAALELGIAFKDELGQGVEGLKDLIPKRAFDAIKQLSFVDARILPFIQKAGEKSAYLQGAFRLMTAKTLPEKAAGTLMIGAQMFKDLASMPGVEKLGLKKAFDAFSNALKPFAGVMDDIMTAHMSDLGKMVSEFKPEKLGYMASYAQQILSHAEHLAPHEHHGPHGDGHGDGHGKTEGHGDGHGKTDTHGKADPHAEKPHVEKPVTPEVKPEVKPTTVTPEVDPAAARKAEISEAAKKLGLNADEAKVLEQTLAHADDAKVKDCLRLLEEAKALGKGNLMDVVKACKADPGSLSKTLRGCVTMIKEMGVAKARQAMELLRGAGTAVMKKVLEMGDVAIKAVKEVIIGLAPVLEKVGLKLETVGPKIGKFMGPTLAKVIPGLGAVAAGYDAARLGKMAATGTDFKGKAFADKDIRALALIGANLNAADAGLAITELFGVGNVAFAANIGMALGEIAIDVAIEHYNEHPDKMPQGLRTGIRAATAGLVAIAPLVNGPIAYQIYKDDIHQMANQVVDFAKKTGKQVANALMELGDAGKRKLGEMVEAMDQMGTKAYRELQAMGAKGKAIINGAVDRLAARPDGLGTLAKIYKQGGGSAVVDALWKKLQSVHTNSSFSNGYKGYRDFFNQLKNQALALGGEAAEFAKKIVYDLGKKLDNSLDDWVPDVMYSWAKP